MAAGINKGKQRAGPSFPLVPREFLASQIDALGAPLEAPAASDYAYARDTSDAAGTGREGVDRKTLEKAVKALNKQLQATREKKLPPYAVEAIAEQIEYLKAQQAGSSKPVVLDAGGKLRVDREDWLNDLPPRWPGARNDDEDAALSEEYAETLASVRALVVKRRFLQQKTEYYEQLLALLEDEVDLDALQRVMNGSPLKEGVRTKKKRKKVLPEESQEYSM